jgi:hypothetical protein
MGVVQRHRAWFRSWRRSARPVDYLGHNSDKPWITLTLTDLLRDLRG